MAKSLKEALLEKFSDLQELGIAPTTAPIEDEGPSVIVDVASDNRRDGGNRRGRPARQSDYDDESRRGGDVPIRPRSRPRRPERGEGRPGGDRPRRPSDRPVGGEQAPPMDAAPASRPGAPARPVPNDRPRFGDRPPFTDRPTVGNRPPFGDRPFQGDRPPDPMRRPGPPMEGGPGQFGTTDRLRQRAEQRKREDDLRETLKGLLVGGTDGEIDDAVIEKFFADLTVEVGALPPLERVVEAVQLAGSTEPAKVGDQVRQLYRRPRPRPPVQS